MVEPKNVEMKDAGQSPPVLEIVESENERKRLGSPQGISKEKKSKFGGNPPAFLMDTGKEPGPSLTMETSNERDETREMGDIGSETTFVTSTTCDTSQKVG